MLHCGPSFRTFAAAAKPCFGREAGVRDNVSFRCDCLNDSKLHKLVVGRQSVKPEPKLPRLHCAETAFPGPAHLPQSGHPMWADWAKIKPDIHRARFYCLCCLPGVIPV